jgi:DnaK suppressor protein
LAQLHLPGPHGPLSSTDPEIFRSLVSGARAALRDVQAALWRIDEGDYGRCVRCAEPVGLERLEILPQTALCMTCQRAAAAT